MLIPHSIRVAALLALILPATAVAQNGAIALWFDGSAPCRTVPCGTIVTLQVYALFAGPSRNGITGVEYKIAVGPNNAADPDLLFLESFDPAATIVGNGAINPPDPLPRGVNMAWPSCQLGDGTMVLLETIQIFNIACFPQETQLQVVKHSTPSNQFFQCPLFTLCDAPVYTKVCVGGPLTTCMNPEPPFANNATCSTSGTAWINPSFSRPQCRPMPVTSSTWTGMKGLYR